MAYYYNGWGKYVSVREKREKARKKLSQLMKKNPSMRPVTIKGKSLANSWWGKAWNVNLERYSDYSNRIGRGRSYVRNDAILDLKIEKGKIYALVQGSESKPYSVNITIKPLEKKTWKAIKFACAGKLETLTELLEGKFPKILESLFTAKGKGLFPSPKEILFQCSCPDWAYMCKHIAAVLYGVGTRLDEDPSLFFILRNVNMRDLIEQTLAQKSKTLLKNTGTKSGRIIKSADMSAMFGIDMEKKSGEKHPSPKRKTSKPGKRKKTNPNSR
jgi:uncharacterized Zn finger protein